MGAFLPTLRRATLIVVAIAIAGGAGPARAAGRHHRRHHRTGKIEVHSLTNGAAILIDGRWVGTVPLKDPVTGLKPGKHKIRVTRLGFMAYDGTVVVRPGRTTQVEADLLAFAGVLDVTANVLGATVTMGKETLGKTPIRGHEVVAGQHEFVVSKDGYQSWRRSLRVIAGKRYKLSASLESSSASLPLVALTAPPPAKPAPRIEAPAPAPAPTPAPTAAVATPPPSKPIADNGPMWHRWWFWAAVGTVVAVAGVGAAASASQGPGTPLCISTPVDGTIGTCRSH